jgi:hypothetical protein
MDLQVAVDADGWRDDARVGEVLGEADLLYVAVGARRGPHVTPAAFDIEGRRLWFVVPRSSVKARAIARHGVVGGLAQVGDRAVLVSGSASILDPITARGVFSSLDRLLDIPFAATGYLSRNYRHAAALLEDHQAPTLPLSRVVVAISLSRVALLESHSVAAAWGSWEPRDLLPHGTPDGRPPDLTSVPSELHGFLAAGEPVVLGWQSLSGPMALPAHWRGGTAETSGAAMVLAGAAAAGPACLTADRWGYRLKNKQGILLAGHGQARLEGETARVAVDQERVTWWLGGQSRTVAAVVV